MSQLGVGFWYRTLCGVGVVRWGVEQVFVCSLALMGAAVFTSCSSSSVDSGSSSGTSFQDASEDRAVPLDAGKLPEPDGSQLTDSAACVETDMDMCERLGTSCGALADRKDLCGSFRTVNECGPCLKEVEVCEGGQCVVHPASWRPGAWSKCNKSCGGGSQSREVACVRDDDLPLTDAACSPTPKPSTSQSCNTQACCQPSCASHSACGDDGCGHSCGTCDSAYGSHAISCTKGVCTWLMGTDTNLPCNTTCGWGGATLSVGGEPSAP